MRIWTIFSRYTQAFLNLSRVTLKSMTRVTAEILEYLKTDLKWLKWIDGELVNVSQPSNRIWILENTPREFLRVFPPVRPEVAKGTPLKISKIYRNSFLNV